MRSSAIVVPLVIELREEIANELDFQDQLDAWLRRVNARTYKTLRARSIDRLKVDEVSDIPFDPQAANLMFMLDTARRGVAFARRKR